VAGPSAVADNVQESIRRALTKEGADPRQVAEMMSLLSDALHALDRAQKKARVATTAEAPVAEVMTAVDQPMASLLQSYLAEQPKAATLEVPIDDHDIVGWVGSFFTWWRRLIKHQWLLPPEQPETVPDTLRVAILGDWGTGLYGAPHCKENIEKDAQGFNLLVHLGDVYYSGTQKEVQQRFLDVWPQVPG